MMGRIDNQMQLLILDLDSMIPENHLLRQIKNSVNFDFIPFSVYYSVCVLVFRITNVSFRPYLSESHDSQIIADSHVLILWNQIRTQIGRGSFFKFSISMVL